MLIEVEDPEEFLSHYGVKGMRWGVRRKRGPGGRVTRGPRSEAGYRVNKRGREMRVRTDNRGRKRKGSEKLAILGSAYVINAIVGNVTGAATKNIGVALLVGNASAYAGGKYVRQHIDKNRKD